MSLIALWRKDMNRTCKGLKSGVWSGRSVNPEKRLALSSPVVAERPLSIFSTTYCKAASMSYSW
jgi:hypothetical protein